MCKETTIEVSQVSYYPRYQQLKRKHTLFKINGNNMKLSILFAILHCNLFSINAVLEHKTYILKPI